MPPLYVSDQVAGLVFWTLFCGWTLVDTGTYLRLRRGSPGRKRDRGSRVVLIAETGEFEAEICIPVTPLSVGQS